MTTKKRSNAEEDLGYIVEPLQPFAVSIDSLVEDPANANTHDDRSIRAIMGSLARYKQRTPLVINTEGNVVEKGNGTLEAARRLGWTHVAAIFVVDDGVTHTGYSIADNRTGELSHFDEEALARLLEEIAALDEAEPVTGMWTEEEWEKLKAEIEAAIGNPADPPDDPGADFDQLDELVAKWAPERGQLWEIPSTTFVDGAHRLLCGDATDPADVERLMDGKRAALFATDPPYLVDYDGTNHPTKWHEPEKNKDWSGTYHDWDDSSQGEELYEGFVSAAVAHAIDPHAAWYCWHASRRQAMVEAVWERHGAFVHQQIIWMKDRAILTRSWYLWQHEPCFFGWVRGQKPKRVAKDYPPSVWEIPTIQPGTRTDHPTSKPIALFALPMEQHTVPGDCCYEPFAGSGSQLVAGEQLGRLVYGIEIQPAYVAVILERMAGMGLKPRLVEDAGK